MNLLVALQYTYNGINCIYKFGRLSSNVACLKTNAGISRFLLDVTPPKIVFQLVDFLQYLNKLQYDLLHMLTQCAR